MNSNELNNYINSLNEFGNNELKVKLENFYLFNKPVISFFKGIDSQFQSLMSAKSIDENVVIDIIGSKEILNALTNAKRELFSFDEIILSESVKNKLLKNYDYIVNTMVLNETIIILQKFYTLLSENELALKNEKEELENLRKKKIEDDRKKKEEEIYKEELRLAEIELKKQEEKRKLKEQEEKRKQDEIRIKQEKERLEKERIEAVKRKELEEKRKEELRLAEIEHKNQEEKRKLKEIEEKRRQEELCKQQERDRINFFENYLKNDFINDLLDILKYNYPYEIIIDKNNFCVGEEYKTSKTVNQFIPIYTKLIEFEIVLVRDDIFKSRIEVNTVKREFFIKPKKNLFSDTKYFISHYNDVRYNKSADPLTFFENRETYIFNSTKGCYNLNWRPTNGHKNYGSIPNWLEIREHFDFFMDGETWGFKRK